MKKSMIAALLLMSFLMVFCAACGGNGDSAELSEQVTDTTDDLPMVTPPPAEDGEQTGIAAEDNSAPTLSGMTVEYVSEAHEIAVSLIGQDVQALYDAIGEPNNAEYVVGCYEDGDDGLLYYDGFYVNTYRYTNGVEIIQGAFASSESN